LIVGGNGLHVVERKRCISEKKKKKKKRGGIKGKKGVFSFLFIIYILGKKGGLF